MFFNIILEQIVISGQTVCNGSEAITHLAVHAVT